ncbi:MAG: MauE/DoxX family redox-associated membrane protein [Vicinamibacteria bacterium]
MASRGFPFDYRGYDTLFARIALGAAFLSAVADRFGIWGPPGATNVAWGDFTDFTAYAARINPWAPSSFVPVLAWAATLAEIVLGVLLIVGFQTRWASFGSGVLLLLFALGMTMGTGIKTGLDASVFAASALGFVLSARDRFPLSLDESRRTS